ncbi:hypothetical protein G6011_03992 [Alternaria panax]|uniref:ABM domain-containing protein n=1 Tax=Alternaria panax TaxID=48097 RepID=A0AAD4NTG8_9PLEO|nr:hypothetical protein G6011_03992 [Alternaria panax]
MTSILTTARLVFKDLDARQKAIDAFHKIIQYTIPHEPEVLQYVCALPVDEKLETEIYMIEEYANQAASDAHLATKPVQDLINLFTAGDVLAHPPEVHNCPVVTKKTSASPIPISSNPAIVLMNIPSRSGLSTKDAGKWDEMSQIVMKSVNSIFIFTVVEDHEANSTRVEAVLQDWDAFTGYEEFMIEGRRDTAEVVKVRPIDGFVGRESASKL